MVSVLNLYAINTYIVVYTSCMINVNVSATLMIVNSVVGYRK